MIDDKSIALFSPVDTTIPLYEFDGGEPVPAMTKLNEFVLTFPKGAQMSPVYNAIQFNYEITAITDVKRALKLYREDVVKSP